MSTLSSIEQLAGTGGNETTADSAYQALGDGFIFDEYDTLPVFCSFLPGIAGEEGVPLWAMYLNRGQGIVSFGMQDKDHAVMEFLPATLAWQLAPLYGFRTFLRIDDRQLWEPFGTAGQNQARRRMIVQPHSLRITELQDAFGLETIVDYATLAGSPVPALLRTVRIRNHGGSPIRIELLDGMPVIVPAGISDFSMKKQRRITEAFCRASLSPEGVALFAPPASTKDASEVAMLQEATFYGAWTPSPAGPRPLDMVVDPDEVFGAGGDFTRPRRFEESRPLRPENQNWSNRLPCAFAHHSTVLEPGAELRLDCLSGYSRFRPGLSRIIQESARDFDALHIAAREVIGKAVEPAASATASLALDGYIRQNFLDNILRGGCPVTLPSRSGSKVVYLYTRRHGDLERDYNDFHLPPFPLSEGSGNFRDILQNRRHDVWFHPGIAESELAFFFSLIQPDGYNPLAIDGYRWRAEDWKEVEALLPPDLPPGADRELQRLVTGGFMPGQVLRWARMHITPRQAQRRFLESVLTRCNASLSSVISPEGFWIDHWIYLLDLIEAFEGIFPDRMATLLHQGPRFSWCACTHGLYPERGSHRLAPLSRTIQLSPVTLLARLCALVAVKAMALDEEGRGIEMEAGRPGWNDAMNGLPGLRGSSTCETAALLRLCEWLEHRIPDTETTVDIPAVFLKLFQDADRLCGAASWDYRQVVAARIDFRSRLYAGQGQELTTVSSSCLRSMVLAVLGRCRRGIEAAHDSSGKLLLTYFYRDPDSPPESNPKALPLFLEGQVHLLRLRTGRANARQIHQAVRASALFDAPLQMYKLNASLQECPYSIGRARTFNPGAYENESIWLHMSYKYLVELLRAGLHKEFFEDCRTMLVPFMDPEVYGRSIFENTSFLASSACPEPALRGRGFAARLSGSTAEFIHMWLLMTMGEKPFVVDQGELVFRLDPVLPGEWFRPRESTLQFAGRTWELPAGSLATAILGKTLLVYHNARRASTFGEGCARPLRYTIDGEVCPEPGPRGRLAEKIRAGEVARMDVLLG